MAQTPHHLTLNVEGPSEDLSHIQEELDAIEADLVAKGIIKPTEPDPEHFDWTADDAFIF